MSIIYIILIIIINKWQAKFETKLMQQSQNKKTLKQIFVFYPIIGIITKKIRIQRNLNL